MKRIPIVLLLAGCPGSDNNSDGETDDGSSTGSAPTSGPSSTAPSSTSMSSTSEPTTMSSETVTATEPPMTSTGSGSGSDSDSESSGTTTGVLACPYKEVDGNPGVTLEEVADGFDDPVLVVGDPVDHDVLYVLQKGGEIKRLDAGVMSAPGANWLDVNVITTSEAGLLGLAFHPDYATNGLMYIAHTPSGEGGAVYVTEYEVDGDGEVDTASARDVIGVGQSQNNHNGGMIQFGPDDMLYISIGDGGIQYDGCGHGQDTDVLLGKILRIDPESDGSGDSTPACNNGPSGGCSCSGQSGFDYTIPADNPFVGTAGVRDEIYAYGFRNPWRFSFDPEDGSLWVADVGQDVYEEVSVIQAGDNAGWGEMEGNHCHNDGGCDTSGDAGGLNSDGLRVPVIDYNQGGPPCAVIGLGNYRSCEVPDWSGRYFYADACTRNIFAVSYDGSDVTAHGQLDTAPDAVYGGGYNVYGDVYVATASQFGGTSSIFRIAPE